MPSKERKHKEKDVDVKKKKSLVKGSTSSAFEIDREKLIRPDDQLVLEEKDLDEEITKILSTTNPIKAENLVHFNYGLGEYELRPDPGDNVLFYTLEGTLLERGTAEYKQYLIDRGADPATIPDDGVSDEEIIEEEEEKQQKVIPAPDEGIADVVTEVDEEEEGDEEEAPEDARPDDDEEDHGGPAKPKKQMNMFNYCERAALTYVTVQRTTEAQTIPPPRDTYSGQVHQWCIYDALAEDHARQEKMREKKKEKKKRGDGAGDKKLEKLDMVSKKMAVGLDILERMINQNTYNDIAQDYRFWDDPADEFKEGAGTLLPLWKFSYDKAKKMTVTDIRCNPWYYDLFGVTFGSFDFTNRLDEGYMCLFTVKNPSYPESICKTNAGCMCVDIHPTHPYFIVVGLYDGNVCVFNVQQTTAIPQFKSDPITQKHTDIVWEVQWAQDLPDGDLNFFSISGDGKVNQWVLLLNSFTFTTVMSLYMDISPVPGPDGTLIKLLGCGSCLRLHPTDPLLYMVGTEEGSIFKCSTQYSFLHVVTYPAHDMPVYRIDFNHYDTNIFISCSGDWRIKIWEDGRTEPLFVFDLGTCVGDVRWAPYSSTVFAAVTNDGKVHVYDINVNKYKPMCIQNVVNHKRNKLTRLAFNTKLPIIFVGDDKGTVSSLKLSPNLRLTVKATKKQQGMTQEDLQKWKLEKILSLMREPKVLERPPEVNEDD